MGFKPLAADPGLYFKDVESDRMYLLVYVDDILIAARSKADVDEVKNQLLSIFEGDRPGGGNLLPGDGHLEGQSCTHHQADPEETDCSAGEHLWSERLQEQDCAPQHIFAADQGGRGVP